MYKSSTNLTNRTDPEEIERLRGEVSRLIDENAAIWAAIRDMHSALHDHVLETGAGDSEDIHGPSWKYEDTLSFSFEDARLDITLRTNDPAKIDPYFVGRVDHPLQLELVELLKKQRRAQAREEEHGID